MQMSLLCTLINAPGFGFHFLNKQFGVTQRLVDAMIARREDWLHRTAVERRQFFYYLFSSEGGLKFIRRMSPGQSFRY